MISHAGPDVNEQLALTFITTEDHAYTLLHWPAKMQQHGVRLQVLHWEQVLTADRLQAATFVMTDLDRLSPSELEAASLLTQHLQGQGMKVLNHPGRFLNRAGLIRTLYASGVNSYTCHLPAFGEWPTRYPVFLRTMAGHRGVLSDLLTDRSACAAALHDAIQKGHPAMDLAFVEFAGAPTPETGHYRKLSAYRVGEHVVRACTVNDTHWMAKSGIKGLASDEEYRLERDEMLDYPLRDEIKHVFNQANCDFGRVDFACVNGRYEYYEINTNPFMGWSNLEHPNPYRRESLQLSESQLIAAFKSEATEPGRAWLTLGESQARLRRW